MIGMIQEEDIWIFLCCSYSQIVLFNYVSQGHIYTVYILGFPHTIIQDWQIEKSTTTVFFFIISYSNHLWFFRTPSSKESLSHVSLSLVWKMKYGILSDFLELQILLRHTWFFFLCVWLKSHHGFEHSKSTFFRIRKQQVYVTPSHLSYSFCMASLSSFLCGKMFTTQMVWEVICDSLFCLKFHIHLNYIFWNDSLILV